MTIINSDRSDCFYLVPLDVQKVIIDKVARGNGPLLQKLMTVHTTWQHMIAETEGDQFFWKPVFDRCVSYPIDLSNTSLYQEKLKITMVSRKEDLQKLLNQFFDNEQLTVKSDLTHCFEKLITSEELETLALCLLCIPSFDHKEIVKALLRLLRNTEGGIDVRFCIKLLVKLSYAFQYIDESDSSLPSVIAKTMVLDGVTIEDLKKCSIDVCAFDPNDACPIDSYSFFYDCLITIDRKFYPARWMGLKAQFHPPKAEKLFPSFKNEKLDGYKRTTPISEEEVKEILRGLVKCNLNLDIKYSDGPINPPLSVLDCWKKLANDPLLPADNVFKVVLDEYELALLTNTDLVEHFAQISI